MATTFEVYKNTILSYERVYTHRGKTRKAKYPTIKILVECGVFIMTEKCENLANCGFFLNFKGNMEVVKQGWINMYCMNSEKWDCCKRKLFKKQTQTSPPDNMSPNGKIIGTT